MMRPAPVHVVRLIVLVLVYFAAGRFGLSLAIVSQSASAVWPPTGIAIAACLLFGRDVWPAILIGSFLVNLTTSQAVVPSLLIAAGNSLECVVAAWLVSRFSHGVLTFETTPRILAFGTAVLGACAIAATVGVGALLVGGLASRPDVLAIWLTWWLGDVSGALLITPVIVLWARSPGHRWSWPTIAEATVLFVFLVSSAAFVFGPSAAGVRHYPFMFVVLPFLVWCALRFGRLETMGAVLVIATIATVGTLQGYGPFVRSEPNESLLLLQVYLGIKAIVVFALAAEVSRRHAIETEVRQLNAELGRRVEMRTEELQRLHGRLVEAQHVAHVGSWEWDIGANTVWWSDELYHIYAIPVGTPVSYESYLQLVHPDDRGFVDERVQNAFRTGEPFTFDHRIIRPDGSVRVCHSNGRVEVNASGRPVRMMGIGLDITDRTRAEEERLELVREQLARREAEESGRMKDRFLAMLSHELRTPVNAILGWALILRKEAADEVMRHRAVDAISRNATIQAQLVSDILDVARIRSGTMRIEPTRVSLAEVVDAALDAIRPLTESKPISVSLSIPEDADAVVGDPARLQQVFWNLLSNAARFTPGGGHIVVTAARDFEVVEITVEDDGPGIEEEFLPHVFEQFRQADTSPTREHGGLGLGLTITHDVVRLHGGTISAGNRERGGAVFTVRLPACEVPAGRG
jgi:signal transduction histidine kinase/integral membrane sensor domain MASE1